MSLAKAKAKEYFKNSAYETIRSLRNKFEDNQAYQFLPSSYMDAAIQKVKSEMTYTYTKLNTNIIEVFY